MHLELDIEGSRIRYEAGLFSFLIAIVSGGSWAGYVEVILLDVSNSFRYHFQVWLG